VERLSRDKKLLKIEQLTSESAARECMPSVHGYLERLLIAL
jgi:hypothetical protein